VVHLDGLQILDEQNLDVIQPFLVVVRLHPEDVVVDEVPLHQLKMDCFLDEVDVEPHHLQRMDYFRDEELVQTVLVQLVSRHFLLRALPLRALLLPLYLLAP
jgi:hypothetical protein